MYQRKYVLEILKSCDMEHCNASNTPVEARLKLSKRVVFFGFSSRKRLPCLVKSITNLCLDFLTYF